MLAAEVEAEGRIAVDAAVVHPVRDEHVHDAVPPKLVPAAEDPRDNDDDDVAHRNRSEECASEQLEQVYGGRVDVEGPDVNAVRVPASFFLADVVVVVELVPESSETLEQATLLLLLELVVWTNTLHRLAQLLPFLAKMRSYLGPEVCLWPVELGHRLQIWLRAPVIGEALAQLRQALVLVLGQRQRVDLPAQSRQGRVEFLAESSAATGLAKLFAGAQDVGELPT